VITSYGILLLVVTVIVETWFRSLGLGLDFCHIPDSNSALYFS